MFVILRPLRHWMDYITEHDMPVFLERVKYEKTFFQKQNFELKPFRSGLWAQVLIYVAIYFITMQYLTLASTLRYTIWKKKNDELFLILGLILYPCGSYRKNGLFWMLLCAKFQKKKQICRLASVRNMPFPKFCNMLGENQTNRIISIFELDLHLT